jgi:hypothetical protein
VTRGQAGLPAGDADRAAAFNGATSRTRFADIGDFAGATRFSVEAWVKPSAVDSVSRRTFSKEAAGTNGWGSSQPLPDTSAPLTIGAGSLGNGSFAGTIDEPGIHPGTALTGAHVQEHSNIGSGA